MNPLSPLLSSRHVPGDGPSTATVIVVGEAPGSTEDADGRPFVGQSGQLLKNTLRAAGFNTETDCFFTNICPFQPKGNDFEAALYSGPTAKTKTPTALLHKFTSELRDEIQRRRPTLVIPVGGEALRAVTGKSSIDNWRGSILQGQVGGGVGSRPFKVIPTYHPARVLREFTTLSVFEHDIRRAYSEWCDGGIVRDLGLVLEINPTFERVISFLKSLLERVGNTTLALDIETSRDSGETPRNHVRCLGIADSPTHALCIPFISNHRLYSTNRPVDQPSNIIHLGPLTLPSAETHANSHWTEEQEYVILGLLHQILSARTITKDLQNCPFDAQILSKDFGLHLHGPIFDTMVASHTLYCELPKDLGFLASLYTKIPYYSDYDRTSDLATWKYNALDCVATFQIGVVMREELRGRRISTGEPTLDVSVSNDVAGDAGRPITSWEFTSETFQENHIQPAVHAMTRIGQRGVLCDTVVRDQLRTVYQGMQDDYERKFRELSHIPTINVASPAQIGRFLYEELKLTPIRKRSTGELTVDEDAIDTLKTRYPRHSELLSCLIDFREMVKLIGTYLNIPLSPDGRLFTTYNPVATVTGRCNSAKNIWGYGTNLQNIPVRSDLGKPLRRMFIADPGNVLIKTDLSQAEFRLVVWFGRIRRLISRYLTDPNFDVHRWFAAVMNRIPEPAVTKAQRSLAKNGVYGGNYHMEAPKAAKTYKMTLQEAKHVLTSYHAALPEVAQWWAEVEGVVSSTRCLVNPFGRTRIILDRLDNSTYRDCYSHVCQSTVGDLIHRTCVLSELILPQYDAAVCMQIHDEVVVQCPKHRLAEVLPVLKQIMEYPLTIDGVPEPLIIPADLSYGPNWLDQTKWEPGKEIPHDI